MEDEREFILEDARSISEGLWHMARYAQDTAVSLDARIDGEELDSQAEAVEVREALERLQALSLAGPDIPGGDQAAAAGSPRLLHIVDVGSARFRA